MSEIDAHELLRRLRALDAKLAAEPDRFSLPWRLELSSAAVSPAEIERAESVAGIRLPALVRAFSTEIAGSARLCWSLQSGARAEFDAEWAGGSGGFEWLSPETMLEQRSRLLEYADAEPETKILPFARDPSSATWLAIYASEFGERIALVHHDEALEEAELARVETFFDDWSVAGFPIEPRWEDQSEPLVALFREVMGVPEPELDE